MSVRLSVIKIIDLSSADTEQITATAMRAKYDGKVPKLTDPKLPRKGTVVKT